MNTQYFFWVKLHKRMYNSKNWDLGLCNTVQHCLLLISSGVHRRSSLCCVDQEVRGTAEIGWFLSFVLENVVTFGIIDQKDQN